MEHRLNRRVILIAVYLKHYTSKSLFIEKPKIFWPTSREYFDALDDFIQVNENFGRDWNFEPQELEAVGSNKVISVVYATSPSFDSNFFATSVFHLRDGLIAEMKTYWAFEDVQPDFRKGLSKVY